MTWDKKVLVCNGLGSRHRGMVSLSPTSCDTLRCGPCMSSADQNGSQSVGPKSPGTLPPEEAILGQLRHPLHWVKLPYWNMVDLHRTEGNGVFPKRCHLGPEHGTSPGTRVPAGEISLPWGCAGSSPITRGSHASAHGWDR